MTNDRIEINPRIMFGKPVIKGTRIPVDLLLRKLEAGMTPQQILVHHPHITVEDIQAAATYAADHRSEEEVVLLTDFPS